MSTEAQVSGLTEATVGGASREQSVHALHHETGLGDAWIDGLLDPLPIDTSDENGQPQ